MVWFDWMNVDRSARTITWNQASFKWADDAMTNHKQRQTKKEIIKWWRIWWMWFRATNMAIRVEPMHIFACNIEYRFDFFRFIFDWLFWNCHSTQSAQPKTNRYLCLFLRFTYNDGIHGAAAILYCVTCQSVIKLKFYCNRKKIHKNRVCHSHIRIAILNQNPSHKAIEVVASFVSCVNRHCKLFPSMQKTPIVMAFWILNKLSQSFHFGMFNRKKRIDTKILIQKISVFFMWLVNIDKTHCFHNFVKMHWTLLCATCTFVHCKCLHSLFMALCCLVSLQLYFSIVTHICV